MEEREDFVNIFKTQVKMVLDILLNVAVSEITHIFQGTSGNATIQNTVLPVALCAGDHAIEAVQACRLKNALEMAICTYTRETTEVTPRATQHDGGEAPSGSVAMPRRDDGEDMHINLKYERLDMDWEVVKVGVFEEGDSIGNSMHKSQEYECLVSELAFEPSTSSEVWDPHCIHTEDSAATTTTLSLCSNDNVLLNSPTDRLTEQEAQVGSSQAPHPVPLKWLLFPLPISVSPVKEVELERGKLVGKLEPVPIAISTPVDSEQQPAYTLRTIDTEPMLRTPVGHLETLTDYDITGAAVKEEPLGSSGQLELKEEIELVRHTAQPSTQRYNDIIATTQLSTLQEPILTQGNPNVHVATQASIILNPAAKEEQRDRGGPVLSGTRSRKGCDTTSTALQPTSISPHRSPLTPSTPPLLPHDLEKQMRRCSEIQPRQKAKTGVIVYFWRNPDKRGPAPPLHDRCRREAASIHPV
ncbi:uncharacterized protein ACWYII_030732 isoform 3-T3 [Salvelinus alpinus]